MHVFKPIPRQNNTLISNFYVKEITLFRDKNRLINYVTKMYSENHKKYHDKTQSYQLLKYIQETEPRRVKPKSTMQFQGSAKEIYRTWYSVPCNVCSPLDRRRPTSKIARGCQPNYALTKPTFNVWNPRYFRLSHHTMHYFSYSELVASHLFRSL